LGITIAASIATAAAAGPREHAPAPPPASAPAEQPRVRDTRHNLQDVFGHEMNAKARYVESARVADREGYRCVAGLFRACARAEQVHADRHVNAIAWSGDEAKAFLDKLAVGTTVENLKAAVEAETWDATRLYPALLAQARAENMTEAVRSMNFALAAEREHAALFRAALETLEQRLPPRAFHVCPLCGKTVESLDFRKCPNCFTAARAFIRVE
jgi:rubrerythrin